MVSRAVIASLLRRCDQSACPPALRDAAVKAVFVDDEVQFAIIKVMGVDTRGAVTSNRCVRLVAFAGTLLGTVPSLVRAARPPSLTLTSPP